MASKLKRAFTIIELLVVIVVIGILASVIIVSYSNVSSRSTVASIQSDLTNAKKQLLNFQTQSSTNSFPTAINCTNPIATEICIRTSGSNTVLSYVASNIGTSPSFLLTAKNGSNIHIITNLAAYPTTYPDIVQSGLVLNLDAGNSSSYPGTGNTWFDISGYGGEAVAFNGPLFSNGSFNFDGANDFFRVSRSDLNAGSFAYGTATVNLWFRPSSSGDGTCTNNNIITVESSFEISIGNRANGFSCLTYASSPWMWKGLDNIDALINNQWSMITYLHTNSVRKLYVNASEVFSIADTGLLDLGWPLYPYMTIMARYTGTSSGAEGNLAVVQLYNRALSQSEISQNFNAMRGRYGL